MPAAAKRSRWTLPSRSRRARWRDPAGERARGGSATPGGDRDRVVGARCDHAVRAPRRDEPLDRELVLDGDERTLVGETETGRVRVLVGDEDDEPARPRRLQQPELRRPCPEDEDRAVIAGPRADACRSLPARTRPPPRLVLAVPGDRALEALRERRARLPAEQSLGLVGRPDVAVDLAEPLRRRSPSATPASRALRARGRRSRSTEMSTPVATLITSPATRSRSAAIAASIASASSST